jgi:hypothetical protein
LTRGCRKIADALQVVVDSRNGDHEAQVGGHELMQGEQLHDPIVDFHLELVYGRLFLENGFGQGSIAIQHGMDGLMDGALRQAAHPEKPLLEAIQLNLKMSFHLSLPPKKTRACRYGKNHSLIRSGR